MEVREKKDNVHEESVAERGGCAEYVEGNLDEGYKSCKGRYCGNVAVKMGRNESLCCCCVCGCVCGYSGFEYCRYNVCNKCKKNYGVQHSRTHMLSCRLCGAHPCNDCIELCWHCRRPVCIFCIEDDVCRECFDMGKELEYYEIEEASFLRGW